MLKSSLSLWRTLVRNRFRGGVARRRSRREVNRRSLQREWSAAAVERLEDRTLLSAVIDNFPPTSGITEFGEINTAYYAQSFVAPNGLAEDLTFQLDHISGSDAVEFHVLLTSTTGGTGTGIRPASVLFESGTLSLPAGAGPTNFTVNVGGIDLVDGATYALVLDAFVTRDGAAGLAGAGANNGYAGGHFFFLNVSGGSRGTHFASDWNDWLSSDMAFELTFSPENAPPHANGDTYAVDEDTTLTVVVADGVLSNDTDPDGNTLTAILVSSPDSGSLTLNANGSFSYTPDANFNGEDSFTYKAHDGSLDSNVATVTITINPVNDAPVVDLNGTDGSGIDFAAMFTEDGGAVAVVETDLALTDVDGGITGSAVSGSGDLFVVNFDGRIVRIDPDTGAQTAVNSGAAIFFASGITIDPTTGNLFVADISPQQVVKVDPATGTETIVSSGGFLSSFGIPSAVDVDSTGYLIVATTGGRFVRIDPSTGAQTLISSGGAISGVMAVAIEADGSILVSQTFTSPRTIVRINPTTGAQTVVSSGGFLSVPDDLALDASGNILVADRITGVIRVDPTTGAQTLVSSGGSPNSSFSIVVDASGQIFTTNSTLKSVVRVDPTNGGQTIVTQGNLLTSPQGAAIDSTLSRMDTIVSATVTITNLKDGADESLSADTTGTNITASYNSSTGVLSLTGDDTAPNYQSVLRTVTYNNTSQNPNTTARIIEFVANDGIDESAPPAVTTLTVVAVNDPPAADAGADRTVDEGSTVSFDGSSSSDIDGDSLSYSWDFGDGNTGSGVSPSHVYADNGTYTVTVTVNDGNGGSNSDTLLVTVHNVAPDIRSLASGVINENGVVTLRVTFDDPGLLDEHTLQIDWADGSPLQTVTASVGDRVIEVPHQYLDDGPSPGNGTPHDDYRIDVTLRDDDGGSDTGSIFPTVHNVAPAVAPLVLSSTTIDENGSVTVEGTFTDPGTLDTHEVVIAWGDGSANTVINLTGGERSFSATHQYLDDNPTGTPQDQYTINVTVTDDDGGSVSTTPGLDQQFDPFSIAGSINFAGAVSGHLEWAQSFTVEAAGTLTGVEVFVNGTGAVSDLVVEIRPTTSSGVPLNSSDSNLASVTIPRLDVPDSYGFIPVDLSAFSVPVAPGDVLAIVIRPADPAAPGQYNVGGQTGDPFANGHAYFQSSNLSSGFFLTNGDIGFRTFVRQVTPPGVVVLNVAPTANAVADQTVNEGDVVSLDGSFTDPGSADTHTFLWTVAASNGQSIADGTGEDFSFTPNESGVYTIDYTVTDDDGGAHTDQVIVTVLNVVDLASRVFDDLDNDGVFDPGESGLENVGIELVRESDGVVVAATPTAADGTYEFDFSALGVPAGTYTIRQQAQPNGFLDGKESTGDLGGTLADNGTVINNADSNAITGIVIGAPGTQQDTAGYDFAEIRPSSLQGLVWEDFDDDGEVDFGEIAIEGVEITLSGTDERGNVVSLTQNTDGQGIFEFADLRPGNYAISEAQPGGLIDGKDVVGLVNGPPTGDNDGGTPALSTTNDQFTTVVLATPGLNGINYNFGERVDGGTLSSGQTATIGFWQNKNGQRLIESLNGSADSTLVAQYLSGTFSNMYGMLADANGDGTAGDYMTNVEVADLYQDLFKRNGRTAPGGPPKLDAQVLAVAFATYITKESFVEVDFVTNAVNTTLVAEVESFGFVVTIGGVGSTYVNVGDNGAAFGVADGSDVQVIDLLLAVNSRSTDGLLYDDDGDGEIDDFEEIDRIMANDIFSLINEM